MKLSKRHKKPPSVVFIDFVKAFDTVSHKHIWDVLEKRGVDEHIREVICNSYRGCHTTIQSKIGMMDKIWLGKGVKQGDPMSLILFKRRIDPLLYVLEKRGTGFTAGFFKNSATQQVSRLIHLSVMDSLWGSTAPSMNVEPWILQGTLIHMIGSGESERYCIWASRLNLGRPS